MPPSAEAQPLVTAVIPTHSRAELLPRAIRSVLSQTYAAIETVVVVDGPDPATSAVLDRMNDPRIRVVQLDRNVGGADARNAGVAAARGEWIAFLDDDDEWLPEKIGRQMEMLKEIDSAHPILSSRFVAKTSSGEYVWPSRFPEPSEAISEYLFVRRGVGREDGIVATPTILARRSLLQRVPFQSGLRKHQDWDWVLRVMRHPEVRLVFCRQTLAICHMTARNSTSRRADWKFSLSWIRERRKLVTSKAYSSFIATHVGWQAAEERDWRAFFPLLGEALRGYLRPIDLARYIGFWFVRPKHRDWIKRMVRYIARQMHDFSIPVQQAIGFLGLIERQRNPELLQSSKGQESRTFFPVPQRRP